MHWPINAVASRKNLPFVFDWSPLVICPHHQRIWILNDLLGETSTYTMPRDLDIILNQFGRPQVLAVQKSLRSFSFYIDQRGSFLIAETYSNLLESNVCKTLCSQQYALHSKCCMNRKFNKTCFCMQVLDFQQTVGSAFISRTILCIVRFILLFAPKFFMGLTGILEAGFW